MSSLHERAKELFLAALGEPPASRDAFLEGACRGDAALRREVESLLDFHQDGDRTGAEAPASGPGTETSKDLFATGEVFASRYRMVTRLGRGGMGDVWRADDLVLETPVALKFIRSASPEARVRILNEVRLARQITHPAVCRVFDVGEAEDHVFLSMELVRGEDLASLLRRVGRVPSEKVIEIARQLCGGLAAAHAQGVLHRDLKPANVLIDDNGLVRITDFGIAVTRKETGRHTLIGTPGYMAPEQLTLGTPLSDRTDVFALGVVLYELLTGQLPFEGSITGRPAPPSTLVDDVDRRLERVILEALSLDPAVRPASAAGMAEGLPSVGTRKKTERLVAASPGWSRLRIRRWLAGTALVALVVAGAVASLFFLSPGGRALTERDTIMLADFVNTTGEPMFDGALKVALAVALEQSPFLKVFPDERARDTLRLMKRSPDEPIARPIAREIAQREQLKALLAGSIASLGRNYVIALEAINAQTGDVMAREQVEAARKEEVLTALGNAASRLREKLGESLASIQKFDVPLPRATTPSLEALHAYSLALDDGRSNVRLASIPHLKRAIELDPDFALALARLSGIYTNTGQTGLAPELSRKAFDLRDRVSERERFLLSWRYYRDSTQEWDKALELALAWTAAYPREAFAFNSLGGAYVHLGQYEEAVEPFREALRLDPKFESLYPNLAGTLMALNRFAEAKSILQQAATQRIDFDSIHRIGYLVALAEGDSAAMARHLEASSGGTGATNAAFGWQARASAFAGRVADAHEQFRRGLQIALQGGFEEVAAGLIIHDAETHAVVGQCGEAQGEVSAALARSRDNFTLERASRVLAWCGAAVEMSELVSELARRFPTATLTHRVSLPIAAAALASRQGESMRALDLLDPLRPYDHASWSEYWPAYLRGLAHLRLKNGREALVQFQSILDRRGEVPDSPLYPLARLGLARAAALAGDLAKSRQEYEGFFALWNGADPSLRALQDARREYAQLR
jgi:tetratricopeptide (TPR) repeat protein/predicted Ser/Thr protein kinase